MLGNPVDLDKPPIGRAVCKVCAPPQKPKFEEIEGEKVVLFIQGDRVTTVGKACPWFEEACAEIRKEAGQEARDSPHP